MEQSEKQAQITKLYHLVLKTANEFLYNCKHFKIEALQKENPTYEEVAEIIDSMCKVITALCEDVDDPLTGQKAFEYCAYMKGMAVSIKNGNEEHLRTIVNELDKRSFL